MQSMYNSNFMNKLFRQNNILDFMFSFVSSWFSTFLLVSSDYYLLLVYKMKKLLFLWFNAYYLRIYLLSIFEEIKEMCLK